jgi:hypothetical protein
VQNGPLLGMLRPIQLSGYNTQVKLFRLESCLGLPNYVAST